MDCLCAVGSEMQTPLQSVFKQRSIQLRLQYIRVILCAANELIWKQAKQMGKISPHSAILIVKAIELIVKAIGAKHIWIKILQVSCA